MNNTCRIAAGHLGGLLAKQRAHWDFREFPLTPNGRAALWFITDENDVVESINVAQNEVGSDDVPGLSRTIATCRTLRTLDLSDNDLVKLTVIPAEWQRLCDAISGNRTLTDLNLNNNKLGPIGAVCRVSFIEPGTEHVGAGGQGPACEDVVACRSSIWDQVWLWIVPEIKNF